jgi:hypothetical protein
VVVPVDVVNVKLADVYWLEVTEFTVILFVDSVWVTLLVMDGTAPIPARVGALGVSEFDVSRATDGAYPHPFCLVNRRKAVLHQIL